MQISIPPVIPPATIPFSVLLELSLDVLSGVGDADLNTSSDSSSHDPLQCLVASLTPSRASCSSHEVSARAGEQSLHQLHVGLRHDDAVLELVCNSCRSESS